MDTSNSEARGRRIGGWIAGVLVAMPAGWALSVGFAFTLEGSTKHSYPWLLMLAIFGLFFVGPVGLATIAGREIGARIAESRTRNQFFDPTAGLELDALPNERLLTLWHALADGQLPAGVPSHRVAAVRNAIRQVALRRGLELKAPRPSRRAI